MNIPSGSPNSMSTRIMISTIQDCFRWSFRESLSSKPCKGTERIHQSRIGGPAKNGHRLAQNANDCLSQPGCCKWHKGFNTMPQDKHCSKKTSFQTCRQLLVFRPRHISVALVTIRQNVFRTSDFNAALGEEFLLEDKSLAQEYVYSTWNLAKSPLLSKNSPQNCWKT